MKKAAPIALLAVGILILMYPALSNKWNEYRCRTAIAEYESDIKAADGQDLDDIWRRAYEYNRGKSINVITDAFSDEQHSAAEEYTGQLNPSGNGIMGYIDIPRIKQCLPIYHGTSEEVLDRGCGHLEGTSLPVGGKGTHAVIAGHRGLPSAKLFTDLDKIKKKDHFDLHILDRVLAYEVDQIKTVLPEDTEDLQIEEDKDIVTLVTCTPYGVNTHRLLIRGHRVKYEEAAAEQERPAADPKEILLTAAAVLAVFLILIIKGKLTKARGK